MAATLTLGELRSLASLVQASLFPLDDAGVPGQETFALQRHAQVRIGLDERAGDPVPNCARLPRRAAAVDAHANVELALHLGHLERSERQLSMDDPREVLLDRAPVEPRCPVAGTEDHAGDGGFPLARAAVLSLFCHQVVSSRSFGDWASCGCSGPT